MAFKCLNVLAFSVTVLVSGCVNTTNFSNNERPKLFYEVLNYVVDEHTELANKKLKSDGFVEIDKSYNYPYFTREEYDEISHTPLGKEYKSPQLKSQVVSTSEYIDVDLSVKTTKKLKYKPGIWLFDPHGKLDPTTAIFVETARKIINDFDALIAQSEYEMSIHAHYTGGADAIPISKPILYRQSDIGSIDEIVSVLDRSGKTSMERVKIENGGYITTNTQLALVRAKTVSEAIQYKVKPIKLVNKFYVELSNDRGGEYRFVQLTLRLKRKQK